MIRSNKRLILPFLISFCQIASAYDFEANGIYYHVTSSENKTVEVTYRDNSQTATPTYIGEITIPETVSFDDTEYTVTGIGDWAFCRCNELTGISLPSSIESIGSYSFWNCSKLTAFPIPERVTTIGNRAFHGNTSFSSSSAVSYIDNYLVAAEDKSLSTYTIAEGTKWIGSMAFSGCSGMTEIIIPSSVKSIENHAFKNCSNLSAITIPLNVEHIGYFAFEGCSNLSEIHLQAFAPLSVDGGTFNGVDLLHCTLYVPFGTKPLFQEAPGWGDFEIIIEQGSLGDVNNDGKIDQEDYKAIANYILRNKRQFNFNESAADVNHDKIISVSDISHLIIHGIEPE